MAGYLQHVDRATKHITISMHHMSKLEDWTDSDQDHRTRTFWVNAIASICMTTTVVVRYFVSKNGVIFAIPVRSISWPCNIGILC
jgi:Mg2+/citrate symporter